MLHFAARARDWMWAGVWATAVGAVFAIGAQASAQEAEWIWLPNQTQEQVPVGTVAVFRKTFDLNEAPESAQMVLTADDKYDAYVNGRAVNRGDFRQLQQVDISSRLRRGRNVIAIRVTNERGGTAALAARVMIKQPNRGWASYSTNQSWKAHLKAPPLWSAPFFNDSRWPTAVSHGRLGETPPWDRDAESPAEETDQNDRFTISEEFEVRMVMSGEEIGSLIAMTFNEFGEVIVSQEQGPLLLLADSDDDGQLDKATVYCDQVKNCQGLLALNGDLFVTGDGPDGAALYRCSDTDNDNQLDQVTTVLKFKGGVSEHGVHGLTLGPDGYLYIVVGNHARPDVEYAKSSPHRTLYEGDLVPRYEDPGGHAVNVKAPGGVVIRTDSTGSKVERFAGGIRNAYDLVFNKEGELFVHDSDMESDRGAPWYRPTSLFHVIPGGEYGWRSGWAKWPDYFIDAVPRLLDTDRGSPTGAVVYDHFAFPARYHNALFLADWSEGRILAVKTKPAGAGYSADSEVFLKGAPLNVSDLEVGPDGSLYFITGGRGTFGALYRVTWRGEVPAAYTQISEGISQAIRQPQLHSAWARQKIAEVKEQLGEDWQTQLYGVAISAANPDAYRLRAMDLMNLLGPAPPESIIQRLAEDKSEAVRAKAAALMALHPTDALKKQLIEMLDDGDRLVRRKACEALARLEHDVPGYRILPLLASDDRLEAWSARLLLERQPVDTWRDTVLKSDDHRLAILGGLALLNADASDATEETARAVIERYTTALQSFISDRDFVDMLRVMQVAVIRGDLPKDSLSALRSELEQEFPAGNPIINRELMRLLAHLKANGPLNRYLAYLESDAPAQEKVHVATHLRFIDEGWGPGQKLDVLRILEQLRQSEGGGSYSHYLANVSTDFARTLNKEDSYQVFKQAEQWPGAALGAMFNLPPELSTEQIQGIIAMDRRLSESEDSANKRLRVGIVAILARTSDTEAMKYLREMWESEPERRASAAMGLAQAPEDPNWPYLMRSLHLLDGESAIEVLTKLQQVRKAPAESEYLRQAILCGLRNNGPGAMEAAKLLAFWTGEQPAPEGAGWKESIQAWQGWFAKKYPNKQPAELPTSTVESRYELDELLEFLASEEAQQEADVRHGEAIFAKAECSKCHRFRGKGESLGPDLTSIAKRFTRREVLQSILYPSHVISDQYATRVVQLEDGRQLTGLLATGPGDEMLILNSKGEKLSFDKSEIERTKLSAVSSMPEGLLNELELQDILDLFQYLGVNKPAQLAKQPAAVRK